MDDTEVAEIIKDFLIESSENLTRLERELVELEKRPRDAALLGSIFRTFHTIKGTCGFLHFTTLERVTHGAESLLNQLRNGDRALTPPLVTLVLTTVDAIKAILSVIEATQREGPESYEPLRQELAAACEAAPEPEQTPVAAAELTALAVPAPTPAALVTVPSGAPPPPATLEVAQPSPPGSRAVAADSGSAPRATAVADSTIRVDVALLDNLMNLVGELVLVRNQILQSHTQRDEAALSATAQRLNLITTQVQESVMKTRMQPIGMVWNKLPRVVRDLAAECGKQVAIEMDGADTELDKSIIESIKDPLTHIVRNCCDHGIEKPAARVARGKPREGRLNLRAFHEGGQLNIEISDDGAGIDLQKLKAKAVERGLIKPEQAERIGDREATNLIFLPGLSTADKVTNISGRGVGMDVVRTNIERIGGTVDVVSRAGEGSTVKIRIPLAIGEATELSKAAVEGKLATRGDAARFQGSYREIIDGVNQTLDAVVGPLNVTAEYLDRISKGDIPPKVTDSYNGDDLTRSRTTSTSASRPSTWWWPTASRWRRPASTESWPPAPMRPSIRAISAESSRAPTN
jgi:two-component system chemotaxis sensor kinase CheA